MHLGEQKCASFLTPKTEPKQHLSQPVTHQNGEASEKVVDEDNATDQVGDLQGGLYGLWAIYGWAALALSIFHNNGGHVELVLIHIVSSLDGEGLEEGDADADDTHGHTTTDQQQEANTEAQANLRHNEAAVMGIEALAGVMPPHSRQSGQDEGDHPDAHNSVYRLLLCVA